MKLKLYRYLPIALNFGLDDVTRFRRDDLDGDMSKVSDGHDEVLEHAQLSIVTTQQRLELRQDANTHQLLQELCIHDAHAQLRQE